MDYTYKNITITGAESLAAARRQAVVAYLQQSGEPTEPEITALLAEVEAEEAERFDLAELGRQVAAELAYLDTTIAAIDGYAAAQVRDVVKRLAQENRAILKALRLAVRRLA